MSTYAQEVAEERATLEELGAAVSANMPDGWTWTRKPDDWGATLHGPEGAELFLSFDRSAPSARRRERVTVYAAYPREAGDRYSWAPESDHQRRRVRRYEITVATSRGPATIAREIGRRILAAGYPADLAAVKQWQAAHVQYGADAVSAARELAAMLPGAHVTEDGRNGRAEVSWYGGTDVGHLSLRVTPDSVYIDRGTVPLEKFRRIAAILAE